LKVDFKTQRAKIFLDSPAVPGWNEIDAVGLLDEFGITHWATGAQASSTYAEPAAAPQQPATEVEKLRKEIMELRRQLEEQQKKKAQREAI